MWSVKTTKPVFMTVIIIIILIYLSIYYLFLHCDIFITVIMVMQNKNYIYLKCQAFVIVSICVIKHIYLNQHKLEYYKYNKIL